MSTIIIKDYGISLRYRKGLMLVSKNGNVVKKIPLANVEEILVLTSGVMISSKLIRAVVRANINLVFMSHKSEFRAKIATEVMKRIESKVRYQGQKVKLEIVIKRQARKIARFLRGEEDKYTAYIERW